MSGAGAGEERCRVCLMGAGAGRELRDALRLPELAGWLQLYLDIRVSAREEPHSPRAVCSVCVSKLEQFHAFRELARRNQLLLQEPSPASPATPATPAPGTLRPLPDCEYNSDSLLEFLNNTENVEEYLRGLGDADALDLAEELASSEDAPRGDAYEINADVDVLDSELDVVRNMLAEEVATDKLKSFSCLACETTLDDYGTLVAHVKDCEPAVQICFKCSERFVSKNKMLRHRSIHNAKDAEFNCDACRIKYDNLTRHSETHNQVQSVDCTYRCKECGSRFKDRFKLYRHANTHIVKSEMQICNVCRECFTNMKNLNEHKRTFHGHTNSVLYRCKVCRIVCPDRRQLYLHVKKHTEALDSKSQQHLCHCCGKSYITLAALNRHEEAHRLTDHVG